MEFVARVFLESPLALAVFCFLLFAGVLLVRTRMPDRPRRFALPGVLLLIPTLFAIQRLIVTERERIRENLDRLVIAVEAGDMGAFGSMLHVDYDSEGMDREAMIAYVTSAFRDMRVYDTRCYSRSIIVMGNEAEMNLLAAATVSRRGEIGQRHTGQWQIRWSRDANEWRVTALRPVSIDPVNVGSLKSLRGYSP